MAEGGVGVWHGSGVREGSYTTAGGEEVRIVWSPKRRRTVEATVRDGQVVVRVPGRMTIRDAHRHADDLTRKLSGRRADHHLTDVALHDRARALAARYDLPEPSGTRWSSRQQQRWGSCAAASGQVTVSDRLRDMPEWVLDAVLVHELAHLVEANHSKAFRELEARYERTAEADAFLAGVTWADRRRPLPTEARP